MSYNIDYPGTSFDKIIGEILSNESISYEIYDPIAISTIKEITTVRNDDSSSQKFEIIDSDEFPKIKESPILKYALKVSFDKEIKEKMYRNISFRKFISEIEKLLFIFTEMRNISFDGKIYFQQDWEVKDLKNIILKIKFHNIQFERELWLWEDLSHFIRKELRMGEFYVDSREIVIDFENYSKVFYIKVDLA